MPSNPSDSPPAAQNAAASANLPILAGNDDNLEAIVAQAERLLRRLRRINFVPFETMAAKDAVPHLREGPIAEVRHGLDNTLRLLRAVSRLTQSEADFSDPEGNSSAQVVPTFVEGGAVREGVPQPMLDTYVETLETWLSGEGITSLGAEGAERPAQVRTLARMLENMAAHLVACRTFIVERLAHPNKWGLIAAGEEGRRKARRTLRAAMVLASRLLQPHKSIKGLLVDEPDALTEAQTSRELVMRARADLLTLVDVGMAVSDSDLGPQMREVRMRIVQLMGAQGYGDLRVSDRHVIGLNVADLNAWLAKPWNDFGAARQILGQVAETALRLGAINLRSNLLKHDRAIQQQALTLLEALEPEALRAQEAPPAAAAVATVIKFGQKARPTAQQKRLSAVAQLVGSMRWRSQELQQFFDTGSEETSMHELTLGQVQPLTQMVRRALR